MDAVTLARLINLKRHQLKLSLRDLEARSIKYGFRISHPRWSGYAAEHRWTRSSLPRLDTEVINTIAACIEEDPLTVWLAMGVSARVAPGWTTNGVTQRGRVGIIPWSDLTEAEAEYVEQELINLANTLRARRRAACNPPSPVDCAG